MWDGLIAFVSAPASARPLAVFRIGLAAVLLFQAYWLAANLFELYGKNGIIQWEVTDQKTTPGIPHLKWAANYLEELYVNGDKNDKANAAAAADDAVRIVFLVYAVSLACLLLGWRTRLVGFIAWLTHLAMNSSANSTIYGVDQFANIGLFYSIWMPFGDCFSLDRLAGRTSGKPTPAARLSLRVLQLHLCIVYFDAGFEKAFTKYFRDGLKYGDIVYVEWWNGEGEYREKAREFIPAGETDEDRSAVARPALIDEDWFNGEAIWVSIMQSDIGPFDFGWLADKPWVATAKDLPILETDIPWAAILMCWGTLILEIGYPIFVWPRLTRKVWVWSTIVMHLGIGITLWLWSFALIMIVFNYAAFLVSPEPPPEK
jgi:hypothetical protein